MRRVGVGAKKPETNADAKNEIKMEELTAALLALSQE